MKLQPAKSHILARFYNPPAQIIKTAKVFDGTGHRTRVEVLAVGPDVKSCKAGDFLLLIPKPLILSIEGDTDAGLFDEASVLGVVLDDTAPLTIVE